MKFSVEYMGSINAYYVHLYLPDDSDQKIASLIGISVEEYIAILKRFNAFRERTNLQYFFRAKKNCQKAVDYLNEKYGVMFKLIGE